MMGGGNSAARKGGMRGWGQCLVLAGSNLMALNGPVWGRREQIAHHTENLSDRFSPDTVTWPLSLGVSGGAETLSFGVLC